MLNLILHAGLVLLFFLVNVHPLCDTSLYHGVHIVECATLRDMLLHNMSHLGLNIERENVTLFGLQIDTLYYSMPP